MGVGGVGLRPGAPPDRPLDGLIARYEALPDGDERTALADTIDRVAAQRYAYVSHLYWYTDLDEAEAAARAAGKPILSLRLLGRLDQDLSCANSRFFRVVLYSDPDLSRFLRERFVLHWSSERAVPRVTIDFGDGRRLETTVAGNSIHYVLDSGGRPVDALPGLWSAASFRSALEAALPAARKAAELNGAERARFLAGYHTSRLEALETIWGPDLEASRVAGTAVEARANGSRRGTRIDTGIGKGSGAGSLQAAARSDDSTLGATGPLRVVDVSDDTLRSMAMTKSGYEAPVVRALRPGQPIPDTPVRSRPWLALGASRVGAAKLGAQSRALMRSLAPSDWSIDARPLDDESFEALVADFEGRIAADSAMNESTLHRRIHSWLASPDAPTTLADLNERVYSELFVTPTSDPWLGMATKGVFSGLPGDGIEVPGEESVPRLGTER